MSYVANLRTFVRVYELGSMSAAGRDQRVSAAVASARIAELERHLGVRLFNRTTRSLQPTEQGAIFYKGALQDPRDDRGGRGRGRRRLAQPARLAARRGAARHRQAADRAADPGLQGPLPARSTCGCACPTAGSTSPPRASTWSSLLGALEDSNLRVRPIADCRRVLCAAPRLPRRPAACRGPARTWSTQRHDCLLHRYPGAREFVWTLVTPDGPQRFEVTGTLESDDGDVLTGWALAGRGIILKPVFEIAEHLARGALVPVAEANPPQDIQLACLYPAQAPAGPEEPAVHRLHGRRLQAELRRRSSGSRTDAPVVRRRPVSRRPVQQRRRRRRPCSACCLRQPGTGRCGQARPRCPAVSSATWPA